MNFPTSVLPDTERDPAVVAKFREIITWPVKQITLDRTVNGRLVAGGIFVGPDGTQYQGSIWVDFTAFSAIVNLHARLARSIARSLVEFERKGEPS